MKKLILLFACILLASCNSVNTIQTNSGSFSQETTETKTSTQVFSLDSLKVGDAMTLEKYSSLVGTNYKTDSDLPEGATPGVIVWDIKGNYVYFSVSSGFGGHGEVFQYNGNNSWTKIYEWQENPVGEFCTQYEKLGIPKDFRLMKDCYKATTKTISDFNLQIGSTMTLGDFSQLVGENYNAEANLPEGVTPSVAIWDVKGNYVYFNVSSGLGGVGKVYVYENNKWISLWAGHEWPVASVYCEPYIRMGMPKDFKFLAYCDKNLDIKISSKNSTLKVGDTMTADNFYKEFSYPVGGEKSNIRISRIVGDYIEIIVTHEDDSQQNMIFDRKGGIWRPVWARPTIIGKDNCAPFIRMGMPEELCSEK